MDYFLNHDSGFHQIMAANLPSGGGKILDLGCGDNDCLARYRTPTLEIWGTDLIEHPTLKHPTWFRPMGVGGAIPFAAETFAIVSSYMVMEHVAQPVAFFQEIARVLKPGGL